MSQLNAGSRISRPHLGVNSPGQRRVLIAIMLTFTGYYFLRTNLTICLGTILDSMPGVSKSQFGTVLSLGYLFYAIGKFISGILIDRWGGGPVFVGGLCGSIFASVLFTMIPFPTTESTTTGGKVDISKSQMDWLMSLFCITWSLNRFCQSGGWGALVKIVSNWFPVSYHGRILGMATLSYGIGDVLIRLFLGAVLAFVMPVKPTYEDSGKSWRLVYYVSVMMAFLLLLPSLIWIQPAPPAIQAAAASHSGAFTKTDSQSDSEDPLTPGSISSPISSSHDSTDSQHRLLGSRKQSDHSQASSLAHVFQTLRRLSRRPKFWILLVMSPCLSLIRETISSWAIVYFSDTLSMTAGDAAMMTMLFPLFGTFSTLIGGWAIDNVLPARRGLIPMVLIGGLTVFLFIAGSVSPTGLKVPGASITNVDQNGWAIFVGASLLSGIALMLMAPFSFVDGLFVLSLAGKHGPGVAVGLLNAVGYTGAILAGHEMGYLAQQYGWPRVFYTLTGVSVLATVMSFLYWQVDKREATDSSKDNDVTLESPSPIQKSGNALWEDYDTLASPQQPSTSKRLY